MLAPLFSIGQRIQASPGSTLSSIFPDEQGEIEEARYQPEKQYWLYQVRFSFGEYILPEKDLRPSQADAREGASPC